MYIFCARPFKEEEEEEDGEIGVLAISRRVSDQLSNGYNFGRLFQRH